MIIPDYINNAKMKKVKDLYNMHPSELELYINGWNEIQNYYSDLLDNEINNLSKNDIRNIKKTYNHIGLHLWDANMILCDMGV